MDPKLYHSTHQGRYPAVRLRLPRLPTWNLLRDVRYWAHLLLSPPQAAFAQKGLHLEFHFRYFARVEARAYRRPLHWTLRQEGAEPILVLGEHAQTPTISPWSPAIPPLKIQCLKMPLL